MWRRQLGEEARRTARRAPRRPRPRSSSPSRDEVEDARQRRRPAAARRGTRSRSPPARRRARRAPATGASPSTGASRRTGRASSLLHGVAHERRRDGRERLAARRASRPRTTSRAPPAARSGASVPRLRREDVVRVLVRRGVEPLVALERAPSARASMSLLNLQTAMVPRGPDLLLGERGELRELFTWLSTISTESRLLGHRRRGPARAPRAAPRAPRRGRGRAPRPCPSGGETTKCSPSTRTSSFVTSTRVLREREVARGIAEAGATRRGRPPRRSAARGSGASRRRAGPRARRGSRRGAARRWRARRRRPRRRASGALR